jgi:predicted transcriptional regulator
MKTANLPPLRVEPELRRDAERLLREGETLSSFVEQAVREAVQRRSAQGEFVARGLASAATAREIGEYVPAKSVLAKLEKRLDEARKRTHRAASRRTRR